MPTENRSSNTESIMQPLAQHPEGRREWFQKWVLATKHPVLGYLDGTWLARGDDREGYADKHVQGLWVAYKEFGQPAQQPHPEPIAWMVGTAFWWTKVEAERDAAETGLPIVGLGPMTDASEIERLVAANTEYARRHLEQLSEVTRMDKATAFVQRLVDCSGTQPSVATGYLRDILDELKGNTTPTAPVDRDERVAFEHHHRICDLVRDEDCPEYYRNQSVQDSWEGWQARAEQEIRP